MFETIFALLLTPWAALSLLFIAVLFDHNRHEGWASFTLIGVFTIAYFMFDVTLLTITKLAGLWLVLGIVYSFCRWMWQCRCAANDYEEKKIDKHEAMRLTHLGVNKGAITYWTFAWPISLVATLCSDLLTWLGKGLHFMFGNAYHWVSDRSRSRIAEISTARGE